MTDERPRTAPSERFAPEHLAFDLHAEAAALEDEPTPKQHGHRQKTLFKNSGRTVALFVLDPGASLAEHATSGIVTVQAIEGDLDVTAGGVDYPLRAGMLLVMAPGVRHDVRAQSRAVFLLQVSLAPKPSTPSSP
jgi:quercetin dioxygenase-like cupin family protein